MQVCRLSENRRTFVALGPSPCLVRTHAMRSACARTSKRKRRYKSETQTKDEARLSSRSLIELLHVGPCCESLIVCCVWSACV